jgi:hypothetical protein
MLSGAPLTDEQFERARRLALGLAGIELLDRHRDLLRRRSARLAMPPALDAWLAAAEEGDTDARRQLHGLLSPPVALPSRRRAGPVGRAPARRSEAVVSRGRDRRGAVLARHGADRRVPA